MWPAQRFTDGKHHEKVENVALGSMCLPWPLFFAGAPCLQPLINTVEMIYAGWLGMPHSKPFLWTRMEDGSLFAVDFGDGRARRVTMSEDLVDNTVWN